MYNFRKDESFMKGDTFRYTPQRMEDSGITPNLVRLTGPQDACNHLYFHNRSFTPDDKTVIFQSTRGGGNNLFAMELASGQVRQLTQGYQLDYFAYPSRDRKKVFFGAEGCIKTVDLETLEEEIIVRAQDLVEAKVTKCSGAFPSWDGKKLVCFYEANPDYAAVFSWYSRPERRRRMYKPHPDFKPHKPVTFEQLQAIMDAPVLDTSLLPEPVIIESFTLYRRENAWFLKVRGTKGEEGIAPCSDRASYLHLLLKKFLPLAIGKDARTLEEILNTIYVTDINYKIQGLAYWCCIAWLESAILDMLGKAAGVHIAQLLGGRQRDELEMYVASGNRDTTPEEEVEILHNRVDKIGAKAIKFKLGGRMSRNRDSIAGRTEGLLHLARKSFGDDFIIHCDGNGSFDARKGIEIGRIAESINAYFYEEPCPFDDLWDTKAVADALDVPLAFGEQETSLRRFAWIIENDAAQVLQPDLQYTGGFIQCIKVARMAQAAGKVVTPHVSGGYASYNMLLFCAIIPNAGHYHEYKGFRGVEDCVPGGLPVKNGLIRVPNGPGLGLDIPFINTPQTECVFEIR